MFTILMSIRLDENTDYKNLITEKCLKILFHELKAGIPAKAGKVASLTVVKPPVKIQ